MVDNSLVLVLWFGSQLNAQTLKGLYIYLGQHDRGMHLAAF